MKVLPDEGDHTRARIIRAATELFAEHGYHATGMAQLAEAVNLGRGALYYHIRSKEELLFEITKAHVEEMVSFGESLLRRNVAADVKLRLLSRGLMRTIADNLEAVTVSTREIHSLTGFRRRMLLELRSRFDEILSMIIQEGVDSGILRSFDPILVKGVLGMHNLSYMWLRDRDRLSPEEIADVFIDCALDGVRGSDERRHLVEANARPTVCGPDAIQRRAASRTSRRA
jgi:AcrR family transcriptional regulator